MAEQHNSHVLRRNEVRTVFFAETGPGESVRLMASRGVSNDRMAWAVLRMIEGKRLEASGAWREDLKRLEGEIEARRAIR